MEWKRDYREKEREREKVDGVATAIENNKKAFLKHVRASIRSPT
jgi:hypothetical protein